MLSDIPSTPGIYRITCTANSRFYIGSAINLATRRNHHLHHLRQNTHRNSKLQRAFNKYGEASFIFEVLEIVLLPEMLTAREQYWFDKLKPFGKRGFNIDRVAGSRLGQEVSLSTREKLRIANLGKKQSEELILKRTAGQAGKKRSPEFSEKMRSVTLGHPVSDAAREKMSQAKLGKKQSEASNEKRSLALAGRIISDETRAQISASNVTSNEWRMKTLIVTAPDGTVYTAHGIGKFCREHSLNRSALIQVAKGKAPHHKGWTARYDDCTIP